MSTMWGFEELSEAEWEHLARLGGVDPIWLRLRWLLSDLLTSPRDKSLPGAVPGAVKSATAALLAELHAWWCPPARPHLELLPGGRSDEDPPASPYTEAWRLIENNITTYSALSLAKLLLSLSDRYRAPYSFRECAHDLDELSTELALRVVIHFANFDDEDELSEIGAKVAQTFPHLMRTSKGDCV